MVDFSGSHVVVTGGTGALGRAVIGALRKADAICHVPNLVAAELDDFPYSSDPGVRVARGVDLADETAVRRFYQALPPLWASIHLAGGFAMAECVAGGRALVLVWDLLCGLLWRCVLPAWWRLRDGFHQHPSRDDCENRAGIAGAAMSHALRARRSRSMPPRSPGKG